MPSSLIVVALVVIVAVFLLSSWKRTLVLALIAMVIEGALRAWVFPEQQEFIYFVKDGLLLAAYARFAWEWATRPRERRERHPLPLLLVIGAFATWVVFEAANPALPNAQLALFGLRQYLLYLPLIFLVPAFFETTQQVFRALWWFGLSMIPIGILGILQFFSGYEDNRFLTYVLWTGVDEYGLPYLHGANALYPRISGTFPFVSGYTSYLLFVGLATVLLLWRSARSRWWIRLFTLALFALIVVNLFMTGSRGPVAIFFICSAIFFMIAAAIDASRRRPFARRVALLGLMFLPAILYPLRDAPSAFWNRVVINNDLGERIIRHFVRPTELAITLAPWGKGTGATHQAAVRLVPDRPLYSWLPTSDFEPEPERVALELGVPGLYLFYALQIALLWAFVHRMLVLRDVDLRLIALFGLLFHVSHIPQHILFSTVPHILYWFTAGFIPLLPRLDEVAHRSSLGAGRRPPDERKEKGT